MNKICILFCLGVMLLSCKAKRITTINKPKTNNKEVVLKIEEIPENTKPISKKYYANVTEKYIDNFKDIAKEEMRLYNIPASITLAQGILESASGGGRLSVEANNHFGIKCHEWTGAKIYHDDDLKQECFRKYTDAKYSFRDHSLFLTERKRYSKLFNLKKEDYKGWAKGLKEAGYATDKQYPQKLISLIERYNLYEFDKDVLGDTYVKIDNKNTNENFSTYTVLKGDTLYSISKKYNTTVKALQHLNRLKNTSLNIGQVLIIKQESDN